MLKSRDELIERRKYIRLQAPISISYTVSGSDTVNHTAVKDISADGLRFEIRDNFLKQATNIELKLDIPGAANPVHARGKVVWTKKISLEDQAPADFGIEFIAMEEDNKNTFLRFLCDLLYTLPKESGHERKKS